MISKDLSSCYFRRNALSFRLYSRVVQCEIRKSMFITTVHYTQRLFTPVACEYGFKTTKTAGVWENGSRCRHFKKIALTYLRFTARKSESTIRRYRAEAALNGPVTDQLASFTRRFRAVRVRHASIRPNLSRPRGVGPK